MCVSVKWWIDDCTPRQIRVTQTSAPLRPLIRATTIIITATTNANPPTRAHTDILSLQGSGWFHLSPPPDGEGGASFQSYHLCELSPFPPDQNLEPLMVCGVCVAVRAQGESNALASAHRCVRAGVFQTCNNSVGTRQREYRECPCTRATKTTG
jgi:hypothetical protein